MTTPAQFNFSFWKPDPKIEIFNDANDNRNTFTQITNPNYGGGYTDTNPYTIDSTSNNISYTAGTGTNSIQFYNASIMGTANVTVSNFNSKRLGIAYAYSIEALQNFIYVKNTSDLENLGYSGYEFDFSTFEDIYFAHDLDNNGSVSIFMTGYYFIVYDIDTVNQTPSGFPWDQYNLNQDGNTGGNQYLSQPFGATDTQFIFIDPETRPTNFNDYFYFSFNYQPFLRIDKTIEDSLGTTLTISQIVVNVYYLDEDGVYNSSGSYTTNSVTKEYDNLTDTYIIYPTYPFNVFSVQFETAIFIITYTTNAGEIIKHQTALSYANPSNSYVYPTGYIYDNSLLTFYLPLYNETLKSIDSYSSGINIVSYNGISGYITANAATYVNANSTLPITYTTSKNITRILNLRFPDGNTTVNCGNTCKNIGYSPDVYYDVPLQAGIGMVELTFQNFHVSDKVSMEIPIGTTKFNTDIIVSGGFRAYVDKTSALAQTARVRVTSPYALNYWKVTTSCVRPYISYTTNQIFQFDNEYTKIDIATLSPTLNTYVPAISGVDYIFDSVISPTVTAFKALTNLRVLVDNDRVIVEIDKKYMYSDPFTGTPIYHGVIRLEYPHKTVIGNDLNNPKNGDIKITRMNLEGIYQYFVVNNPQDLISNCSEYKPKCFVPAVTGFQPMTVVGMIEYVKDSNTYTQPLSIREAGTHNITMLDGLGSCFTGYGNNFSQSLVSVDYRGMILATGLPTTKPTSGWGQYWNVNPVNNTMVMPYSQPFYGNTTGEKFFFYQLLNSSIGFGYQLGSIDQVKISIMDPISGNYSTTLNNVNNQGGNPSYIYTYTKFNGYTTNSIIVTISGNPEEMYSSGQVMYNYVRDIQIGEIIPSTQKRIPNAIIKPNPAWGPHSYTNANSATDYTYSNGNYYANIPLIYLSAVTSNPLIPTSPDNPNTSTNDLSYYGNSMCLRDIVWSPEYNKFVIVGDFIDNFLGLSAFYASTYDGVNFYAGGGSISSPVFARSFNSVCWSSGLHVFCAGSSNYKWIQGVGSTTGETGYVYTTVAGVATSGTQLGWAAYYTSEVDTSSIVWSESLNLFAAVGHNQITDQSRIVTSSDGITWTDRASNALAYNAKICWSEPLSLFCVSTGVVSVSGYQVLTSSNGITWTPRYQAAQPLNFSDITWSDELGVFVMVAGNANFSVALSSNGIDWNIVSTPTIVAPTQVLWIKELGLLYILDYNGIYISTNGINWTYMNDNPKGITRASWSPTLHMLLGVNNTSVVNTL
jgi:hypothetical protein